jgi:hypothetical protein
VTAPQAQVTGVGLWLPGYPSAAAWSTRQADPQATAPLGRSLGRTNRRRAGPLGRALADAAAEAAAQAAVDLATAPTVIGSAIGEAATMIGLLDQLWRGEPMSPAAFTVSVHTAASGLISISNCNRGFATSIAADHGTPAAALLEAIGLVQTRGCAVLVACADETIPTSLTTQTPPWELVAAAVVVAPAEPSAAASAGLARLRIAPADVAGAADAASTSAPTACLAPPALEDRLARNPQAGMVDLVDAVLRRAAGWVRLDRGRGPGWCAHLEPLSLP